MKPRLDVCQKCDNYHLLVVQSTTEEDTLKHTQQFKEHFEEAQKELMYYLDCMTEAEESSANALVAHHHTTIIRLTLLNNCYKSLITVGKLVLSTLKYHYGFSYLEFPMMVPNSR